MIQLPACPSFYRCLHCPPKKSDVCRSCFRSRGGGLPPCPSHNHCYIEGDLRGQACCWRPAINRANESALPAQLISSIQGRDFDAGDYDLLLRLDDQTTQQSLPHFLCHKALSHCMQGMGIVDIRLRYPATRDTLIPATFLAAAAEHR